MTRNALLLLLTTLCLAGCGGSSAAPQSTSTPRPQTITRVGTIPPGTSLPVHGARNRRPRTAGARGALPRVPTFRATPVPIPATAFNSVLHGTVTDASSRRPLSGALVALQDGHTSVRTDNKGRYSIKWPGGYTYSVTVDMRGYLGSLMAGRIKAYKSFRLNFALRKKSASNGSMPSPPGFFNGG